MLQDAAKIIFYIVHIMEFITYIPQIGKLIKTKSSKDISVTSQVVLFSMNVLWLVYWSLTKLPINQLIFCICVFIEVTIQVFLVFIYRNSKINTYNARRDENGSNGKAVL